MQRVIKSFVKRGGRISNRQQAGLDSWFKAFQLPIDNQAWDFNAIFNRIAPTVIEIGFGM